MWPGRGGGRIESRVREITTKFTESVKKKQRIVGCKNEVNVSAVSIEFQFIGLNKAAHNLIGCCFAILILLERNFNSKCSVSKVFC